MLSLNLVDDAKSSPCASDEVVVLGGEEEKFELSNFDDTDNRSHLPLVM